MHKMSLDWCGKKEDAESRQTLTSFHTVLYLQYVKHLQILQREKTTISNIVNFSLKTESGREFGSWCFGSYSWLLAEVGMETMPPDFLPIYHMLVS